MTKAERTRREREVERLALKMGREYHGWTSTARFILRREARARADERRRLLGLLGLRLARAVAAKYVAEEAGHLVTAKHRQSDIETLESLRAILSGPRKRRKR